MTTDLAIFLVSGLGWLTLFIGGGTLLERWYQRRHPRKTPTPPAD